LRKKGIICAVGRLATLAKFREKGSCFGAFFKKVQPFGARRVSQAQLEVRIEGRRDFMINAGKSVISPAQKRFIRHWKAGRGAPSNCSLGNKVRPAAEKMDEHGAGGGGRSQFRHFASFRGKLVLTVFLLVFFYIPKNRPLEGMRGHTRKTSQELSGHS